MRDMTFLGGYEYTYPLLFRDIARVHHLTLERVYVKDQPTEIINTPLRVQLWPLATLRLDASHT